MFNIKMEPNPASANHYNHFHPTTIYDNPFPQELFQENYPRYYPIFGIANTLRSPEDIHSFFSDAFCETPSPPCQELVVERSFEEEVKGQARCKYAHVDNIQWDFLSGGQNELSNRGEEREDYFVSVASPQESDDAGRTKKG